MKLDSGSEFEFNSDGVSFFRESGSMDLISAISYKDLKKILSRLGNNSDKVFKQSGLLVQQTGKGFRTIELNLFQVLKCGSLGICDCCAKDTFGVIKYVPCINRFFCMPCYVLWYNVTPYKAINILLETKSIARIMNKFKTKKP